MGGAKKNFRISQGEDFFIELEVKDGTGSAAQVVDISGWSWEGEVHAENGGDKEADITFAFPSGGDGTNGRIDASIPQATVQGMEAGSYDFDVYSTDTVPRRRRRFFGKFVVDERFTGTS